MISTAWPPSGEDPGVFWYTPDLYVGKSEYTVNAQERGPPETNSDMIFSTPLTEKARVDLVLSSLYDFFVYSESHLASHLGVWYSSFGQAGYFADGGTWCAHGAKLYALHPVPLCISG